MLSFRNIGKVARQSRSEVELRRLTRQDLLQLLLDQMSETDRLHDELEAVKTGAADLGELTEHLKTRLDDKDAQIAHLQTKLNEKDALLRQALAYARENVGGGGRAQSFYALEQLESLLTDHFLGHANQVAAEEEVEAAAQESATEAPDSEVAPAAPVERIDTLEQDLPPVVAIDTLGFVDVDTDHAPTHLDAGEVLA